MASTSKRSVLVFNAIKEIFEEGWMDSLTITNIAERCNLHPNTVNYYFNGKIDMFLRFHKYLFDYEKAALPDFYHSPPENAEDAVRAFVQIIDRELFMPLNSSPVRQKLEFYLLGLSTENPQVRYYLADYKKEYCAFLSVTFDKYASKGIIKSAEVYNGISLSLTAAVGHANLSTYYNSVYVENGIVLTRGHILKELIQPKYIGLCKDYL